MRDETSQGETALAFRYLFLFRRIVVGLAAVGAVLAWAYEFPALMAAFVCVGIGELLESSYYLSVLRWRRATIHLGARVLSAPALGTPVATVTVGPARDVAADRRGQAPR